MSKEILINDRFVVNKIIGKGSFGEVYLGFDKSSSNLVAIKLEHKDKKKMLHHEYNIYSGLSFNNKIKIPKVYWFGKEGDYNVLVMDFLGNPLEKLFTICGRKFSIKTTIMIAIQCLELMEMLHQSNHVYRDIKPENFLVGTGKNRHYVHLIDFGLAKKFKNKDNIHAKMIKGKKLVGTARYASLNSHYGNELSRRDDLESLFYMLVYFLKGSLPWMAAQGKTREEKYGNILKIKEKAIKCITKNLPREFDYYFKHVRSLKYAEKPNYLYLRKLFFDIAKRFNIKLDYIYDWSSRY